MTAADPAPDRIAVDTAVWLDGLLHGGSAEELVQLAVTGKVELLTSEALLGRLAAVLRDGLGFSEAAAFEVCRFIRDTAVVVPAEELERGQEPVLAAAIAGGASAIATTETSPLIARGDHAGIPIVSLV